MTLIITEGWDSDNIGSAATSPNNGWIITGNRGTSGNFNSITGRVSGLAMECSSGNGGAMGMSRPLPQTVATVVVGMAVRLLSSSVTNSRIFYLSESGTEQMSLRMDTSGHLIVSRNGTTLATETNLVMAVNTWYYLELKVVFGSGTSGSYAVRRNGAAVTGISDASSVNTIATANAWADTIALNNLSGNQALDYDDLYLCTTGAGSVNDFQGQVRVATVLPSGAGTNTNFTKVGSASTNWQSVNENPPDGDTTYVQSSVVNTVDTYLYQTLSTTVSSVLGVVSRPVVRKDDSGTRTMVAHVRSGGSEADSSGSFAPTVAYTPSDIVMETNPVTSSAWTIAGINAAEFGFKVAT